MGIHAFQRAAKGFAARPGPGPIAEMMRLALEDRNDTVRRWAAGWLLKNCNVKIVTAEQGKNDATAPATAGILR